MHKDWFFLQICVKHFIHHRVNIGLHTSWHVSCSIIGTTFSMVEKHCSMLVTSLLCHSVVLSSG